MPVYEFYCPDCHTVYNFWSQRVNTEKIPQCPNCETANMQRMASRSAYIAASSSSDEDDPLGDLPIDESRLESAMADLESEAAGLDEDDPRTMAQFMRRFSDKIGLKYNDQMEEALSRLEAGEDPDAIEEEMGDIFDDEEMPFEFTGKKVNIRKSRPLKRDDTLYDL